MSLGDTQYIFWTMDPDKDFLEMSEEKNIYIHFYKECLNSVKKGSTNLIKKIMFKQCYLITFRQYCVWKRVDQITLTTS